MDLQQEYLNFKEKKYEELSFFQCEPLVIELDKLSSDIIPVGVNNIGSVDSYRDMFIKEDAVLFDYPGAIPNGVHFSKSIFETLKVHLDSSSGKEIPFFRANGYLRSGQLVRLMTGYSWAKCPWTGRLLRTTTSIALKDSSSLNIAYYFSGEYPFFIMTGGDWFNSVHGIFLPLHNVYIIYTESNWTKWSRDSIVIKLLADYVKLHTNIFDSTTSLAKNIMVVVDSKVNLGHYLWNDLSAIQQLESIGSEYNKKFHILVPNVNLFHSTAIKHENVASHSNIQTVNLLNDSTFPDEFAHSFLTKFSSIRITRAYGDIIKNYVYGNTTDDFKNRILNIKNSVDAFIAINIRAGNKVWLNLPEAITNIFNRHAQSGKKIGLFFDGLSNASGILDDVTKKISNEIICIDGLDFGLLETLFVLYNVDYYIYTVSSGLVLPSWLANKPGIAVGDRLHLLQNNFWNDISECQTNKTFFIPEEFIHDETNEFYSNFIVDEHYLSNAIEKFFIKL